MTFITAENDKPVELICAATIEADAAKVHGIFLHLHNLEFDEFLFLFPGNEVFREVFDPK